MSESRYVDNEFGNESSVSERLSGLSTISGKEPAPGSFSTPDKEPPRFEVAGGAHLDDDSKDERSLSNRLAAAEAHERRSDEEESAKTIKDPLAPAKAHGNEPSKGAKIDAEIKRDEEEYLKKKND